MYFNLKSELWRKGIRQNRFAQILGMDETVLSKIVNGYREPDAKTRKAIAEFLERDEEWLFARADRGSSKAAAAGNTEIPS